MNSRDTDRIETILHFWFGKDPREPDRLADLPVLRTRLPYWYGGGPKVDEELRERFGADHDAACAGDLAHWPETPEGHLALVVLLDQLSRNLKRGTPAMYDQDEKVIALVEDAVARAVDRNFNATGRTFLYMPFMHSEELAMQDRCMELITGLWRESPWFVKLALGSELVSGYRHRQIIQRFGRFPHRNKILGRRTTLRERLFLLEPMSSF